MYKYNYGTKFRYGNYPQVAACEYYQTFLLMLLAENRKEVMEA